MRLVSVRPRWAATRSALVYMPLSTRMDFSVGTGLAGAQAPEVLVVEAPAPGRSAARRPSLLFSGRPSTNLTTPRPVRLPDLASQGRVRPALPLPRAQAHGCNQRLPRLAGPLPGAEVRKAREPAHDDGLHSPLRPGTLGERAQSELLKRRSDSQSMRPKFHREPLPCHNSAYLWNSLSNLLPPSLGRFRRQSRRRS